MFAKCDACNSRILTGGQTFLHWKVCGDDCANRLRIRLVDELVPQETIDKQIQQVFEAECPQCGRLGYNDLYSATKISAFLIMFQINTQKQICCSGCGRKNRLYAAMHCMFAGWWGPKAAICNLFILPTNVLAALFIRSPQQPSPQLIAMIKASMANSMAPQILAALHAQSAAEDHSDPFATSSSLT